VSKYLKIKCSKCETEQIIFGNTSKEIRCKECNEVLAKPTGSKTKVVGAKIIEVL